MAKPEKIDPDEQQTLGEPYELAWGGRRLRFGPVTQAVKARCVAASKMAAIEEFEENLDLRFPLVDAAAAGKRQAATDQFEAILTSGAFRWGGTRQELWRWEPAGALAYIGALLDQGGTPLSESEIESLAVDKPKELAAVVALVTWDATHPKAKRPAELEAAGKAAGLLTS